MRYINLHFTYLLTPSTNDCNTPKVITALLPRITILYAALLLIFCNWD